MFRSSVSPRPAFVQQPLDSKHTAHILLEAFSRPPHLVQSLACVLRFYMRVLLFGPIVIALQSFCAVGLPEAPLTGASKLSLLHLGHKPQAAQTHTHTRSSYHRRSMLCIWAHIRHRVGNLFGKVNTLQRSKDIRHKSILHTVMPSRSISQWS